MPLDRITLLTTTYRTELNMLQQNLNAKYFSFESNMYLLFSARTG